MKWTVTWLLYDPMTHFSLVGVNFGCRSYIVQMKENKKKRLQKTN